MPHDRARRHLDERFVPTETFLLEEDAVSVWFEDPALYEFDYGQFITFQYVPTSGSDSGNYLLVISDKINFSSGYQDSHVMVWDSDRFTATIEMTLTDSPVVYVID